jgi:hypothetical protein
MICSFTSNECTEKPYCEKRGQCFHAGSGLIAKPVNAACLQAEAPKPHCPSLQDGCSSPDLCSGNGECNYTGSPLINPDGSARYPADPVNAIDPRTQPANPKQAYGDKKIPLYLMPMTFAANVCVALYEGLTKYGLVNWRVAKVDAMTYASACKRHVDKWINGEEHDPVTKVSHLANAGACIAILIDAEVCGTLIDNRPYPVPQANLDKMIVELEGTIAHLKELHSDRNPKHYYITDVAA